MHELHKVVYRRYASIFVIVGIHMDENELAIFEAITVFMDSLNSYFSTMSGTTVTESVLMFELDKVLIILDEIFLGGDIIETNKKRILEPLGLLDIASHNTATK